jgi:hypothetical protein
VPLARPDGRLSGDPTKPGAPFVIRLRNAANYVVLPHWHPQDEHIVVVKGTWYVGMGDTFDRAALREMNVGDYTLVPKTMRHFGWAKTEVVIQVHGVGPFEVIPDDAWEMLSGWTQTPDNRFIRTLNPSHAFKFQLGERVRSTRGEGVIVSGVHSAKSRFTQYDVNTDDGNRFFEVETDLSALPALTDGDPGLLAGVWECVAQSTPEGDLPFTLHLRHSGEAISGVISLQMTGAALRSSTFRNGVLELRMKIFLESFHFRASHTDGALVGEWSNDLGLKGSWHGKRVARGSR